MALGVDLADAHYDYGVVLGLQEKWELAAERRTAGRSALNPLHAQARNNLGQMLERRRELHGAAERVPVARVDSAADVPAGAVQPRPHAARARRHDEAIAELDEAGAAARRRDAAILVRACRRRTCGPDTSDEGLQWATEAKRLALDVRPARTGRGHRAGAGETEMKRARQLTQLAARSLQLAVAGLWLGRPRAPRSRRRRPAPLFVESAAAVGLSFTHVSGATGQYYMAEQMGAGVALFDYDSDGDLDVFLVQGGPLEARRQDRARGIRPAGCFATTSKVAGDGSRTLQFTDVTEQAGVGLRAYGMGAAVGDYDNDGDLDLS